VAYAEVAVNSPTAARRTFSYGIPSHLEVPAGLAVWVPFGPRVLQGIVWGLEDFPQVEETRDLLGAIGDRPVLFPFQIELADWISRYYLAPLFESAAPMLPPGFERKLVTFLSLNPDRYEDYPDLSEEQAQVLDLVGQRPKVPMKELEEALGKKKAKFAVDYLVDEGLLTRIQELDRSRVGPKMVTNLSLVCDPEQALREAQRLSSRAPKQAALLEFLADHPSSISVAEVKTRTGCSTATIQALEAKELVRSESVPVLRSPIGQQDFGVSQAPMLTVAQKDALRTIRGALERCSGGYSSGSEQPPVFLLHGITGSGKTEVYLHALADAVSLGKRAIVLVPEIALTPQTIERFASRFPDRVAVLHSKLSLGEQFDQWHQIRGGAFDVVIGSRGAIFSPQPDLGLIVIDEEHEWTYKQQDQSPRYHARDVAIKLAELTGAVVVLGSATPSMESFHSAQSGRYTLLQLPERIAHVTGVGLALPEVSVVDVRQEFKAGNRGLFSRSLRRAIQETLAAKEQVILFLNRRGAATFIQCPSCGFVLQCTRCDLPLTYHPDDDRLMCHQCNYRRRLPDLCPQCENPRMRFLGGGTQRVEAEAARCFPEARLLRWDRDVTKGRYAHETILKRFVSHEADILIGTQMVAKGLDLPSVTLVGVISADTVLHLPDFRAGERTFQLISQVAGRAGRGALPGRVIIQTYTPDNYAIVAAAGHDYLAFYEQEGSHRLTHQLPPFVRLARLIHAHVNPEAAEQNAERFARRLAREIDAMGMTDVEVIGPAPAFFSKVAGRFRWQIMLRGPKLADLLAEVNLPQGWVVDIDPASVL
jgi:primosomal protein N' (replication factor Y)